MNNETAPHGLSNSLLLLRLGVAVVMVVWTADKMVNPDHARAVSDNFYDASALGVAQSAPF